MACVNIDQLVNKFFSRNFILLFPFSSPKLTHKQWPHYNQLIKIIKSKNKNEIIVPTYNGKQGNPVLFSKSTIDKIINIKGDMGAKKIIETNKQKVFYLETNDQAVTKDFNTKESFI